MQLVGGNLIGGVSSAEGAVRFRGVDPRTNSEIEPVFHEATAAEVDRAVQLAAGVSRAFARSSPAQRALFLRAIADELVALGPALIERAHQETALPVGRLEGERGRTVGQLRMFAALLDEGSWVDARIDRGDATRVPAPRPDLRRMLVPLGPVAVFGASNFPFAFSVAGGDTASALAAGCPVVCKAHPAHPGTSELAAGAIDRAAVACDIPRGVFSLVQGWSHEVGLALVRNPHICAVGFTGSLRGGRAILDAAAARAEPIPVYAELGSINPVFLLPSAAAERADALALGLAQSITMGTGQFCTNPGVIVGVRGDALERLTSALATSIAAAESSTMLYDQLAKGYASAVSGAQARGATLLAQATSGDVHRATPALLRVDGEQFVAQRELRDEMFGPVSVVVVATDAAEMERIAEAMEGQLTATIQGTARNCVRMRGLSRFFSARWDACCSTGFRPAWRSVTRFSTGARIPPRRTRARRQWEARRSSGSCGRSVSRIFLMKRCRKNCATRIRVGSGGCSTGRYRKTAWREFTFSTYTRLAVPPSSA